MREINFKVYHYDELSDDAKKKAVDEMRKSIGAMLCDNDAYEYRAALKEIEKVFEIEVYDWSAGSQGVSFRWRFRDGSWSDMSDNPRFLVRYLDKVERYCRKGRFYSSPFRPCPKSEEHPTGFTYTKRYSKVMFERNYTLTGTWTTAVVDDYMEKRWEFVREHKTIDDFVYDMLYDFFKEWERDCDYNYEDEQIEETILANDYEFTEDGRPY